MHAVWFTSRLIPPRKILPVCYKKWLSRDFCNSEVLTQETWMIRLMRTRSRREANGKNNDDEILRLTNEEYGGACMFHDNDECEIVNERI